MTRNIGSANVTAVQAAHVRPILLGRLDYLSTPVYIASTPFPISFNWDGSGPATFVGVGEWGSISTVEEGIDLQTYSTAMQLSHVDSGNLAIALGETYRGRDCRIWLGFVDENHALVGDPFILFRGRMDTQIIDMDPANGSITLSVGSRLQDWARERVRRYTDEDQQNQFPGDLGMQFVAQTVEKEISWGQ